VSIEIEEPTEQVGFLGGNVDAVVFVHPPLVPLLLKPGVAPPKLKRTPAAAVCDAGPWIWAAVTVPVRFMKPAPAPEPQPTLIVRIFVTLSKKIPPLGPNIVLSTGTAADYCSGSFISAGHPGACATEEVELDDCRLGGGSECERREENGYFFHWGSWYLSEFLGVRGSVINTTFWRRSGQRGGGAPCRLHDPAMGKVQP